RTDSVHGSASSSRRGTRATPQDRVLGGQCSIQGRFAQPTRRALDMWTAAAHALVSTLNQRGSNRPPSYPLAAVRQKSRQCRRFPSLQKQRLACVKNQRQKWRL